MTTRHQYRALVASQTPFKGRACYAEKRGDAYVVFSYGEHYPALIYKDGVWHENSDKVSVTTTHHKGYCRPVASPVMLSTLHMKALLK